MTELQKQVLRAVAAAGEKGIGIQALIYRLMELGYNGNEAARAINSIIESGYCLRQQQALSERLRLNESGRAALEAAP
jgi:hypothetical protein